MEQNNEMKEVKEIMDKLPGNFEILLYIGLGVVIVLFSRYFNTIPNDYSTIGFLLLGIGYGQSYVVRRLKKKSPPREIL